MFVKSLSVRVPVPVCVNMFLTIIEVLNSVKYSLKDHFTLEQFCTEDICSFS